MIAPTKGFMSWAGLVLAVSLPLISTQAHAVSVTVGETAYEISSFTGIYNDYTTILQSQTWWGNQTLALDFANAFAANGSSPTGNSFFAFGESILEDPFDGPMTVVQASYITKFSQSEFDTGLTSIYPLGTYNFVTATASPSSVPEINAGSLSQALLILFALWLMTWRRVASRVA
jgi:hypothetical protein